MYDLLIQRMRRLYQLPVGTPDDEVIAERNRRYDADPAGYAAALRKASGVQYHCYDIGSPVSGDIEYPRARCMVRPCGGAGKCESDQLELSRSCANCLPRSSTIFGIADGIRANASGLILKNIMPLQAAKSVIGYHPGLDVELVDATTAQKGYEAYLAGEGGGAAEKAIRDYMIPLSLEICKEFDIPMQFHTGIGSAPMCDLRENASGKSAAHHE